MSIGYFQTDTEMLCNNVGTSFGVGMTAASEGNERMVGRIRKVALINGGRQGKDSSMLLFQLNYAEDTQEGHDHVGMKQQEEEEQQWKEQTCLVAIHV